MSVTVQTKLFLVLRLQDKNYSKCLKTVPLGLREYFLTLTTSLYCTYNCVNCIHLLVLVEPPADRAKTRLLLCVCPCPFIVVVPLKVT